VYQNNDCMIWTPHGAWLQSRDEAGIVRSSFLGRMHLATVEVFCVNHNLRLEVVGLEDFGRDGAEKPVKGRQRPLSEKLTR